MPGPNYNVGITYTLTDKASRGVALLQKRLEKLTLTAKASEKALANIAKSAETITAAQLALDKKTVVSAKAAAREKIRVKQFEERQKTITAQLGERQRLRTARIATQANLASSLAAVKIKNAEELAAAKAATANYRLETLKRRETERAEGIAKRKTSKIASRFGGFFGRGVGYATGGYGGSLVGGGIGSTLAEMAGTPVGIAAEAAVGYLVAGTYAAHQYQRALVGLENAGMGAAQAMNVMNTVIHSNVGAMKYLTVSQGGQLAQMIASTNIGATKGMLGNLGASAANLQYLRAGAGMDEQGAMNTLWALKKSLQIGLSAQGLQGAQLQAKSQAMENLIVKHGAGLGLNAKDYYANVAGILNDPAIMALKSVRGNIGAVLSNLAPMTYAGVAPSTYSTIAGMIRGRVPQADIAQLMMLDKGMGVRDMQSILAGHKFSYKNLDEAIVDPRKFVGDIALPYLEKGLGYKKTVGMDKLSSAQRGELISRAQNVFTPAFANLVTGVLSISKNQYEQMAGGAANLAKNQDKVALAEMRLASATSKLLQAFSNTAGISAMNAMASVINSLSTGPTAATPSPGSSAALGPAGGFMRLLGMFTQMFVHGQNPVKKESYTPSGLYGSAGPQHVSVTVNAKTTASAKDIAGMVHTALKNITSGSGIYTPAPLSGVSV